MILGQEVETFLGAAVVVRAPRGGEVLVRVTEPGGLRGRLVPVPVVGTRTFVSRRK